MSQIDERLDARFDRAIRPAVAPDPAVLQARRRRRAARNALGRAGLAIVVVVASITVFAVFRMAFTDASRPPTPATSPNGGFDPMAYGTYVISDVQVGPSTPDPRTGERDPDLVTVTGTLAWSGERYPGMHTCRWSVFDDDGEELGTREDEIVSLEGPRPHALGGVDVQVGTGAHDAATASVVCDPVRLDRPVGYETSGARVREQMTLPFSEGSILVTVAFKLEGPPEPSSHLAANRCVVEVFRDDERIGRTDFSIAVDRGFEPRWLSRQVRVGGPWTDAPGTLTANVACEPYTGTENSADPDEPAG